MDKRTIILVISLSVTLLMVNTFFDYRHQESVKEWREEKKVEKADTWESLKTEITDKTAKPEELPLVSLYGDAAGKEFLTQSVQTQNSLITIAWKKDVPQQVFANGQAYQLAYSPDETGQVVIYEKQKEDTMPIGNLPPIGTFDLQLITFTEKLPPQITFGKYSDGVFSIPVKNWITLSKELGRELPAEIKLPGPSLVLQYTPEGYLPVATYHPDTDSIVYLEQIRALGKEIQPSAVEGEEEYFVLENEYQQLVFSNRGAALVEINLPFQTKENTNSVVKEIAFDREMVEDHPNNAMFPARSYHTPGDTAKGPFTKHAKGTLSEYYPLLRRDLIQNGQRKSIQMLPKNYGLNIVSEYPEMAEQLYRVTHFDKNSIVFEATQRNRRIVKTYTINKDQKNAPYCFDLSINIEGDSKGLWLTSGIPEVEWISNAAAPVQKFRITRKGKAEVESLSKPKETFTESSVYPDWIANSNGFLGMIIDPLSQIDPGYRAQYVAGTEAPSRLVLIGEEYEKFKTQDLPGYLMMLPLNSQGGNMHFRIYAGPFATNTLKIVDAAYTDPTTGYNPDYISSQTSHGWFTFISGPFSKFLFILMNFFHSLTESWGFSIILLTLALRIMLYPLNAWSTKSMVRMQQVTPLVQKIQEKYKKDQKRAQLEIMNLYRDKGVNPVSGCFPLLIQMPFLIGMFDLLKSTFELRGAPFIPGWIDNLAAPDVLFSWTTPIFFIGNQFHLLPVLLGGVMYIQQTLMSTAPKDPSQLTDQQKQQKMMGKMMTVFFTVMFYHFPSGLNLYWLSSMLLGILQQWWTQKRLKAEALKPQILPALAGSDKKEKIAKIK